MEAGGVEPPSANNPRKASTGLAWIWCHRIVDLQAGAIRLAVRYDLAVPPRGKGFRQPNNMTPHQDIRHFLDWRGLLN